MREILSNTYLLVVNDDYVHRFVLSLVASASFLCAFSVTNPPNATDNSI